MASIGLGPAGRSAARLAIVTFHILGRPTLVFGSLVFAPGETLKLLPIALTNDTVVLGRARANYTLLGNTVSRSVVSAAEGSDTLLSVQRLQFADTVLANDSSPGGNTYPAYAMFNAGFNRGPATTELSHWTSVLDRLGSGADFAQAMITHCAPGVSNQDLVTYLWSTIVGGAIPLDQLVRYVGLVDNGTYTQAGLLEPVANIQLNTIELAGVVGQTMVLDPAYFFATGVLSQASPSPPGAHDPDAPDPDTHRYARQPLRYTVIACA